ncbi:hypothetical protein GW17_00038466 [Ensete ventricosum]|nr:hypothetical protein GW17_00038466 [Ensete ventricosum]RZS03621.1 hypothetical protein BHM03_00033814 [Ensete ventricosum]
MVAVEGDDATGSSCGSKWVRQQLKRSKVATVFLLTRNVGNKEGQQLQLCGLQRRIEDHHWRGSMGRKMLVQLQTVESIGGEEEMRRVRHRATMPAVDDRGYDCRSIGDGHGRGSGWKTVAESRGERCWRCGWEATTGIR